MPEEIRLFRALTPELDGVRQGVDSLPVSANEAASEIDVLEIMFLGLEVSDLSNVVSDGVD